MFHNTKQSKSSKPANLVQTIERMASLLDLVGQKPKGVSIRDLSHELDLPKGTVHRLLSSLAHFGYIRQDPVMKNYSLGLKLLDLGNLVASQIDLRKISEALLHDLAQRCKETVHLVIMDQDEVVYVEKVESVSDLGGLRMTSRVGARNPAHSCAVGKVLLSYLSEKELDDFISRKGLPKKTANTIIDRGSFREHLKMVRNQGYAVDDEENEKGIRCVAGAVSGASGKPVGAISISGPAFRVTKKIIQEVLKKEVLETALKISQLLGFGRAPL
jgi:IclR family transcriptional regulator, KDG regulon repressor